jgi:hypothetical protein
MASFLVRRTTLALTIAALAGCHDVPQGPKTIPPAVAPWVRITMDDGVTDYPSFGGLDLLSRADTEFDFITAETEFGWLQYGGCVQNCQDPARWQLGTVDSGIYRGIGPNASSVRTSSEIIVAYEDFQPSVAGIKVATCGGACDHKAAWRSGKVFEGYLGSFEGTHSRTLAVDPAGGLNLLYRKVPANLTMYYAHCAASCTDSASWSSVFLDSGNFQATDAAITVAPSGAVHVLVQGADTTRTLTYFTCDSGCSSSASWSSMVLATGRTGRTPSILVGAGGTLYATWGGGPVHYGTCSANCLSAGGWSITSLQDSSGQDVSLVLDGSGQPWVATFYGPISNLGSKTLVLHCATSCGAAGSWVPTTIDSLGDGLDISLVVDGRGQPRVAVSGFGLHYLQRRDTTVLAH